jgi:glycerol-3-phosphate acyltransferase PlsY
MSLPVVFLSGTLAVISHNWPVFLQFRRGRGEAAAIGVLSIIVTGPLP